MTKKYFYFSFFIIFLFLFDVTLCMDSPGNIGTEIVEFSELIYPYTRDLMRYDNFINHCTTSEISEAWFIEFMNWLDISMLDRQFIVNTYVKSLFLLDSSLLEKAFTTINQPSEKVILVKKLLLGAQCSINASEESARTELNKHLDTLIQDYRNSTDKEKQEIDQEEISNRIEQQLKFCEELDSLLNDEIKISKIFIIFLQAMSSDSPKIPQSIQEAMQTGSDNFTSRLQAVSKNLNQKFLLDVMNVDQNKMMNEINAQSEIISFDNLKDMYKDIKANDNNFYFVFLKKEIKDDRFFNQENLSKLNPVTLFILLNNQSFFGFAQEKVSSLKKEIITKIEVPYVKMFAKNAINDLKSEIQTAVHKDDEAYIKILLSFFKYVNYSEAEQFFLIPFQRTDDPDESVDPFNFLIELLFKKDRALIRMHTGVKPIFQEKVLSILFTLLDSLDIEEKSCYSILSYNFLNVETLFWAVFFKYEQQHYYDKKVEEEKIASEKDKDIKLFDDLYRSMLIYTSFTEKSTNMISEIKLYDFLDDKKKQTIILTIAKLISTFSLKDLSLNLDNFVQEIPSIKDKIAHIFTRQFEESQQKFTTYYKALLTAQKPGFEQANFLVMKFLYEKNFFITKIKEDLESEVKELQKFLFYRTKILEEKIGSIIPKLQEQERKVKEYNANSALDPQGNLQKAAEQLKAKYTSEIAFYEKCKTDSYQFLFGSEFFELFFLYTKPDDFIKKIQDFNDEKWKNWIAWVNKQKDSYETHHDFETFIQAQDKEDGSPLYFFSAYFGFNINKDDMSREGIFNLLRGYSWGEVVLDFIFMDRIFLPALENVFIEKNNYEEKKKATNLIFEKIKNQNFEFVGEEDENILKVALLIWWEQWFASLSDQGIETIVAKVDDSNNKWYSFFKDKIHLVHALRKRYIQSNINKIIDEILQDPFRDDGIDGLSTKELIYQFPNDATRRSLVDQLIKRCLDTGHIDYFGVHNFVGDRLGEVWLPFSDSWKDFSVKKRFEVLIDNRLGEIGGVLVKLTLDDVRFLKYASGDKLEKWIELFKKDPKLTEFQKALEDEKTPLYKLNEILKSNKGIAVLEKLKKSEKAEKSVQKIKPSLAMPPSSPPAGNEASSPFQIPVLKGVNKPLSAEVQGFMVDKTSYYTTQGIFGKATDIVEASILDESQNRILNTIFDSMYDEKLCLDYFITNFLSAWNKHNPTKVINNVDDWKDQSDARKKLVDAFADENKTQKIENLDAVVREFFNKKAALPPPAGAS